MKNAHASSIKGLSIAVIILSAVWAYLLPFFSWCPQACSVRSSWMRVPDLMNGMRYEYGKLIDVP